MSHVSQTDLGQSGALDVLLRESIGVVSGLIDGSERGGARVAEGLERTIVHAAPHLDEYVADLLFRATLDPKYWACEFLEQSIFSRQADSTSRLLWPTSAVFGIGNVVEGDTRPLYLFDEHIAEGKSAPSCSDLVVEQMLQDVPEALRPMLLEVSVIDEAGGAHQQHLNNLIKTLHDVRFHFGRGPGTVTSIVDYLPAQWKQVIIHASIAAVIWCLNEARHEFLEPEASKRALFPSLDNYEVHSAHANRDGFDRAMNRVRGVYGDQAKVAVEGILRKHGEPVRDHTGEPVSQMLTLGRVCAAVELCWGESLRDVVATHFWESEIQGQLNFQDIRTELDNIGASDSGRIVSDVGILTRDVMDSVLVETRSGPSRHPVWILTLAALPHVFQPNRALLHYLNQENDGCGIILLRNGSRGTHALFAGSAIPPEKWKRLVNTVRASEFDCWHAIKRPDGGYAPFILNGSRAHQYIAQSGIDRTTLMELVKRTFY